MVINICGDTRQALAGCSGYMKRTGAQVEVKNDKCAVPTPHGLVLCGVQSCCIPDVHNNKQEYSESTMSPTATVVWSLFQIMLSQHDK
jgi:hypothetical protein